MWFFNITLVENVVLVSVQYLKIQSNQQKSPTESCTSRRVQRRSRLTSRCTFSSFHRGWCGCVSSDHSWSWRTAHSVDMDISLPTVESRQEKRVKSFSLTGFRAGVDNLRPAGHYRPVWPFNWPAETSIILPCSPFDSLSHLWIKCLMDLERYRGRGSNRRSLYPPSV